MVVKRGDLPARWPEGLGRPQRYPESISNGSAIARAGTNFGGPQHFFAFQQSCYQTRKRLQGLIGTAIACHSWQLWQPSPKAATSNFPNPSFAIKTLKNTSLVTANNNTDDTPKTKPIKKKNPNWSIKEDKQLCDAWLNTSQDSVIKDTSKWQAVQAEIKSKSTKKATQDPKKLQDSSSVHKKSEPSCQADNPDEEEEELANKHEQSLLGSDGRPEGQKAAKKKQTNDDLLDKVLKNQEELLKISKDRSNSIKEAMQNASDDHIMAMNLLD
ncbi:hypothetical protein PCASD_19421 [Puccinia coronata f. sp. avenae]|uniref:No apical meristem-associated C-terminal domain-containing protein n=1 Tax=Puccinia coronata f. sp. avenae TaxID=200324 RepID=A0A2N5SGC7_9BASI|nr:hypothetical protein PCASD_19421 [Puccinia coronata f. sp. avenae]